MSIRDINTRQTVQLNQVNINEILSNPYNGINSQAELTDVLQGRKPDLFVTLDPGSGRYVSAGRTAGGGDGFTPPPLGMSLTGLQEEVVSNQRPWDTQPPPSTITQFSDNPFSPFVKNIRDPQSYAQNPLTTGVASQAFQFDPTTLLSMFGTTDPRYLKKETYKEGQEAGGLAEDAPAPTPEQIKTLEGFVSTEDITNDINVAAQGVSQDNVTLTESNQALIDALVQLAKDRANLESSDADWNITDPLKAIDFQKAWNTVMETGKVPVNAIRFTDVESIDPLDASKTITVRTLTSASQQLLTLQQSFIQQRQFALQLYGVPEDQADTEAGTLAYRTFQEQTAMQKKALSEQKRSALEAEEQARAGLTGYLPGRLVQTGTTPDAVPTYELTDPVRTLAGEQFDLESLLRRAALTGTVPGDEGAEGVKTLEQQALDLNKLLQMAGLTGQYQLKGMKDPADTMAAQQLALETARLYGTPAEPTTDTPTLEQQQFNLQSALARGFLPAIGDEPARRSLEAQRLVGRLRGEPTVLLDAYNRPVLDDEGKQIYQTPLGDQTIEARLAESQMTLGTAASTLGIDRLAEEQRQFNKRLEEERALATGYTESGQTVASRQLDLQRAGMFGTIGDPEEGAQTLEAQQLAEQIRQYNLANTLQQAGLTGQFGDAETLQAQQLAEQIRQYDLANTLQQAGLTGQFGGDQTLESQQLAEQIRQFDLQRALQQSGLTGQFGGDQTLQAQQLSEQQRQFNLQQAEQKRQYDLQRALQQSGITGQFGGELTLGAQQLQAEEEMQRQALEAQQARAALSAVTGLSQTAMQSPYGFGAFRALGGLGGGTEQAQQQITQQLSPIGFQFPQGDQAVQAGTPTPAQRFFPTGIPTLGSMAQLPSSGTQQLQAILGMTGTSPGQFGRLAGGITPSVTPRGQRPIRRRQPTTTGGAAI